MTLIASLLVGPVCGYFFGFGEKAFQVFTPIWLLVLAFLVTQLDSQNLPPDDWAFIPVQVFIFALGISMMWVGLLARAKFGARA